MQSFTQTFAAARTWQLNVPGRYFALIDCGAVNVRLYRGGKKLDLGEVNNIGPGLEIGPLQETFDRVEIDALGADTITAAIGNGQARYNSKVSTPTRCGSVVQISTAVTTASVQVLAANPSRRWILVQNNDAFASLFVRFDGGAATLTNGIKIPPGGSYESGFAVSTMAVTAIASTAMGANTLVVIEG